MALHDWLDPASRQSASAKVAIPAIAREEPEPPIARIAGIAVASPQPSKSVEVVAAHVKPFDRAEFQQVPDLLLFMDDIEAKAVSLQMDAPDIYKNRDGAIAAAYEMCRAAWLSRRQA